MILTMKEKLKLNRTLMLAILRTRQVAVWTVAYARCYGIHGRVAPCPTYTVNAGYS